ncbi:hypothetical protein, variant 1 [Aphanomyces invadans]|uniref:Uncharacterized protein n=1 Tax=Aphanomyces invadans TaxID=157072 RepID=A0A024TPA2_9STRA|nr:hypothetical protein, variant 1 [Aphanomyces invadans]ETV95197.1 hypothetical protein, variant 1 [Aphanomyces invadans]|eukprot:XP_008876371.1 hypothetical protein, variant 1 [Aphanomyces invadans]
MSSMCCRYVGFTLAMITSEKRFGPKFSTGREEEPGPTAYTLPTDFDAAAKVSATTTGFGTAPRTKPLSKSVDYGTYNPDIPGAFPNVYTVEQWEAQKKLHQEDASMRMGCKSPRSPPPRIQVAAGPGSYHTEFDIATSGREGHFSKAKRPDLTSYMESLGQIGDSPGPKYMPDANNIAQRCLKASTRGFPRHNSSPGAIDQSLMELDKSFQKLNRALASPVLWVPRTRSIVKLDIKQSGPGSYNTGSDFVKRSTKKGTFGTAKQMDMLSNLVAAGHVGQTPVGPGQYDIEWDPFGGKTYNTKAGYVPKQTGHTALDPVPLKPHINPSRILDPSGAGELDALPPRDIWRLMRKAPDPKKLGYDK